jgi:lipopolysaccharide export system protein LptA
MPMILALGLPHASWGAKNPSDNTIHIQANDTISCSNPGNIWIARGKVVLKKAPLTLSADCVHVIFESKASIPGTKQEKNALLLPAQPKAVKAVCAQGNVTIVHPSGTLYCDKATYTFKEKTVTATGQFIRMHSTQWRLNCNKSLTYSYTTHQAKALGNACLRNELKGLESQELVAQFGLNQTNKTTEHGASKGVFDHNPLELHWARSPTPVRIWDKKYVARADTALFHALDQKVHVRGNVRIRHKTEYVKAHRASVDLKNNTIDFSHDGAKVYALIPVKSFSSKPKGAP